MTTLEQEINEAVAKGATWLDEHYPNWWKAVDLAVLDVSQCDRCVLGQVYTGYIPVHERDQILAQVLEKCYVHPIQRDLGFNVLSHLHDLDWFTSAKLGFSVESHLGACRSDCTEECHGTHGYAELTDEWTRVIISRRLAQAELVGV